MPPPQRFDRAIVDGPLLPAVWKIAWPSMLQNVIGGLQGVIDHILVGRLVGFVANAAIGVSWQIFLVVIVFLSSLFTGMAILVSRFAGAGEPEKVNRVVYQALLTAVFLATVVLAPLGYASAPFLLRLINAAPEVQAEALPFLRTMMLCNIGLMLFFMLSAALRAAGDAKTPLRLGILMTTLNAALNVVFIRGLGPIPAFGTMGAALGTSIAGMTVGAVGLWLLFSGRSVVRLERTMSFAPDWTIIRSLFRFGLPTGFQGIAMNIAGVLLLRFIGSLPDSAAAQGAYAVGYTELFSFITWTSVALMGATSVVTGQNLGAKQPERAVRGVEVTSRIGLAVAAGIGLAFLAMPRALLSIFGMTDPTVLEIGSQLLRFLSLSGLFVTVALAYTGALQGTGDTKGPLYISIVSQMILPLGLCAFWQANGLLTPTAIWSSIVVGHFSRCALSVLRFRQGKWRSIVVDIEPSPAG
ncbi:MAG: MATE family efflux transporter [Vicinamibacterales bacterium]